MSGNKNLPIKNVGVPTGFGNSGPLSQSMPMNNQTPPHLRALSQPQTQGGSPFPGHFQLSEPQAQALAPAHYTQAHDEAARVAYAQFQAQLQAQPQSLIQLQNPGTNNVSVSSPSISTSSAANAETRVQVAQLKAQVQFQAQLKAQSQSLTQVQNAGTNNVNVSSPSISTPSTVNAETRAQVAQLKSQAQSLALLQNPGTNNVSVSLPSILTPNKANDEARARAAHARLQAQLRSQAQPLTQLQNSGTNNVSVSLPSISTPSTANDAARARIAHTQFQAQLRSQAQSITQLQNPGTNNVSVSSSSILTPSTGNAKRAPQKQTSRPPSSSGPGTASPLKTMELTPAARRRKRKLPDEQIPAKVAALLPESALYTQLLEFEARVDDALARKKIEIQESLKNPPHVQKTLRIYVFNTFANQTQTAPEKRNAEPPSWSLKIIGRILEGGTDPDAAGMVQRPSSSYPKFSYFFKKITIYLDQSAYPDNNHVILWDSSRSPALHEGFEVKRKGDKEFTAIVRLEMNYVPEKFKLSPALTEVLGITVETRSRILAALWHYVKARKLQIAGDPSFFMCDPPLRKIFGEEKVKFGMVSQKISQHLTPPQPIHLEHRIKLSGNSPAGNTCYDVLIDVPFSMDKEMSSFLANLEKHKEINACDEAIRAAIKKIHEHRRRRAFFLGFSQSPAEFINALIASQSGDLKLIAGDASRNAEKECRSDFYNQPWLEDAVIRYLNRKPAAGSDTPGST